MDTFEHALREVLRVVEGAERGDPFGDEDTGTLPRLPYIGDVVREALATQRAAVEPSELERLRDEVRRCAEWADRYDGEIAAALRQILEGKGFRA